MTQRSRPRSHAERRIGRYPRQLLVAAVTILAAVSFPNTSLASGPFDNGALPERSWPLYPDVNDVSTDITVRRPVFGIGDPTDLDATALTVGVNRLTWQGNNEVGTVVYEIWRLRGDTEPFRLIAVTKKQIFLDSSTPGAYYNYKVRAVALKTVSNFSNIAVVYGAS